MTRLQVIDRWLFECLGWSRDRVSVEDYERPDYADYILDETARLLVLEAKKEATYFDLPVPLERRAELRTVIESGTAARDAVEQVTAYANARSMPFAAICNGHQLVAFVATRDDGVRPKDGRALVFASAEEML